MNWPSFDITWIPIAEKTTNYLRRPTTGEDEDQDIVNRRWDWEF